MRERLAIILALLSAALVVLLSAGFSAIQNRAKPSADAEVAASGDAAAADLAEGRKVFEAQGCMRCHSVAREGSPRSPLDGIGAKRDRSKLRALILGDDSVKSELSPGVIAAKRRSKKLADEDLDALVDYLASLR